MNKRKKVVVFGGTGFIGSEFIQELSIDQALDIVVVHLHDYTDDDKVFGVEYEQCDILKNSKRGEIILDQAEYVVLMASPNPQLIESLISIIKDLDVKKILYTSTTLLYSDSLDRQKEDAQLEPSNEYEKKKLAEERLLLDFVSSSDVQLCIARLGNVYGTDKNRGIVQKIVAAIQSDSDFAINGDGEHVRDYIHVQDVVKALLKLLFMTTSESVNIVNVSTGVGSSINHLIELLEAQFHKQLNKHHGSSIAEKRVIIADNSRLRSLTGFTPEVDLAHGLALVYNSYKHKS